MMTKQHVREEIRQSIEAYYAKNFPAVVKTGRHEVKQADRHHLWDLQSKCLPEDEGELDDLSQ